MSWGDVQFDARPANRFVAALRRALAPTRIVGRVLMVYVGVAVPVMSFVMAAEGPPNPPQWRSGELHAHLSYLLTARAGFVFYPLMAYTMACFVLTLFWRERFAQRFLVRLGVYGGVVLGLHYCVVLNVSIIEASDWWQVGGALPFFALFAAAAAVVCLAIMHAVIFAIAWLSQMKRAKLFWTITIGITVFLEIILLATNRSDIILTPLFVAFFISLLCGPFWFTAAYAWLSIDIARRFWDGGQFRLWQLMFVFTWLASYLAACRAAVNLAIAEYNKLPTEPPGDCYIATAAARGHTRVVGSAEVVVAGGKMMRVNRQLQIFKCAEIAIRALCPRMHRAMRCMYDHVGPLLARRIAQPLLADAAYLTLMPAQWLATVCLRCLLRDVELQSSQLYGRAQDGPASE